MKPLVSIILINFNGKKYTVPCIESLRKMHYKSIEIIVIDNGSTDGSLELFRAMDDVILIENKENVGFAEANNQGVRKSKGEYIAILNNDTVVEPSWLDPLITHLQKNKTIGIVMSKIFNKYDSEDYRFDGYGTMTVAGFFAWNKKIPKETKKPVDLFFASGCALVYHKNLVKEPFDKEYFIYAEDTYLSWLARLKGYGVQMIPASELWHEGGAVTKDIHEMSDYFTYLGERNRIINYCIFFEPLNLLRVFPLMLGTIFFNNLYDYKRIFTRCKAYLWILFHPFRILKKRSFIQKQRKVKDSAFLEIMSYKLFEEEQVNHPFFRKVIEALNGVTYGYCKIVRLKTLEMIS